MNIASQLFKRATFPLSGNNVVVQNLLRKLSTSCFFRMSLCLQLIKRPVFTAKLAGNHQGTALNSDCLLSLWGGSAGHNEGGGKQDGGHNGNPQSSRNFLCVLQAIRRSGHHIIVAAILTVQRFDDVP